MYALSPTDSAFLWLETRNQPMHVAGLNLYTPPKGAGADFVTTLLAGWGRQLQAVAPFNLRPVLRLGHVALGGRQGVRARLPPAPSRAAASGPDPRTAGHGVAPARQPDGPQPSVVGGLCDRRPGRRPFCDLYQDPPRAGGRRHRRPHDGQWSVADRKRAQAAAVGAVVQVAPAGPHCAGTARTVGTDRRRGTRRTRHPARRRRQPVGHAAGRGRRAGRCDGTAVPGAPLAIQCRDLRLAAFCRAVVFAHSACARLVLRPTPPSTMSRWRSAPVRCAST